MRFMLFFCATHMRRRRRHEGLTERRKLFLHKVFEIAPNLRWFYWVYGPYDSLLRLLTCLMCCPSMYGKYGIRTLPRTCGFQRRICTHNKCDQHTCRGLLCSVPPVSTLWILFGKHDENWWTVCIIHIERETLTMWESELDMSMVPVTRIWTLYVLGRNLAVPYGDLCQCILPSFLPKSSHINYNILRLGESWNAVSRRRCADVRWASDVADSIDAVVVAMRNP